MKTYSGIKTGPFKGLQSILTRWIDVQDQLLSEFLPDNAPWWYNERASIGAFAAAVWLEGGIAFEEYVTDKVHALSAKSSAGRGDLFFRVNRNRYRAEAKREWGKLRGNAQERFIERNLNIAVVDAQRREANGEKRIGILFLAPNVSDSYKNNLAPLIKDWVNKLQSVPNSSCAWCFPASAQNMSEKSKLYPGCAVIIRGEEHLPVL